MKKTTATTAPTFGSHLAKAMNAAHLTQDALGTEAGLSQAQVSRLVRDDARPTPDQVMAIAKACGVNRYALVGGTEHAAMFPGDSLITVNDNSHIKWLGYFASALTGLTEPQREELFADAAVVRGECESIRAFLYEPSNYTDPVRQPNVPAEMVYAIDHAQVTQSQFVVLHARHPSLGAGQELEIAKNAGIPVVLLCPSDAKVSRMVLGTTARLHVVQFRSAAELKSALAPALEQLVVDLLHRQTESTLGRDECTDVNAAFAKRFRELRTAMKVDTSTLGRLVGLQKTGIEQLESGSHTNPSLTTLRRIAKVLKTSVSYLTEGIVDRPEDRDPIMLESYANLNKFGQEKGISLIDSQTLWTAACEAYATSRRSVAEARSAPISVDEWSARYAELKTGKAKAKQLSLTDDD